MLNRLAGADRVVARRINPFPTSHSYLLRRTLAAQLRAEAARRFDGRKVDVVDVGCGQRPYEPILSPHARSYVGVDMRPGPRVDVVAKAEELPFEDGSFDCLLCTQVLEHSTDPSKVCSEANRVLRPGGVALLSTHGVVSYHPVPDDYWRWTHAGLERLLRTAGHWDEVTVRPQGRTAGALAYLVERELEALVVRAHLPGLVTKPFNVVVNGLAALADALAERLAPGQPPRLAANYLAVAVRAAS